MPYMTSSVSVSVSGVRSGLDGAPFETDIDWLFSLADAETADCVVKCEDFCRYQPRIRTWWDARVDSFSGGEAKCAFLRITPGSAHKASVSLLGPYRIASVVAGGWLLLPDIDTAPCYWIPVAPQIRRCDEDGHVLDQLPATLSALRTSPEYLSVRFDVPDSFVLDIVLWRFSGSAQFIATELQELVTLELQPLFMWSSHTTYAKPSDFYLHMVFGYVYENHAVWPRYWRVCSELDAHALYVSMLGLEQATGKRLYGLLKQQLICAVIMRQHSDGGWYHGEWTDQMESHFRLVAAGVQLLCAAFEDWPDPAIGRALRKAVAFLAKSSTPIDAGVWFLHDSLEANETSIEKYPFSWARSVALGKPVSSMLVLNTHLDTTIAIDRYSQVTGDKEFSHLVQSALSSARAVLRLRTAETFYRLLFWAIRLTFLPSSSARALPLPLRAIKRLAWKYLIPRLHLIKSRLPRFVMPGGFIDRALVQQGCVVRYHPVNLMDIARLDRRFGEVSDVLDAAFAFTVSSGLRLRWKEAQGAEDDSLGFWAEALYHQALRGTSVTIRSWLAEAVIDLSDNRLGLSPSLLGSNPEALRPDQRHATPSPVSRSLRVVNLSRGDISEYLVVNPSETEIALQWELPPEGALRWSESSFEPELSADLVVPARSWLWGRTIATVKSAA